MASDKDTDGAVPEPTQAAGSDRVAAAPAKVSVVDSAKIVADSAKVVAGAAPHDSAAPVIEIGPRAIPAHLSSTGSHGTKRPKPPRPAPSSSTELGFGAHRSPAGKTATAPGLGFADRPPAGPEEAGPPALERAAARATDSAADPPRFVREALASSALARIGSGLSRALRFAFGAPRTGLWSLLVVTCAMIAVGVSALAARHVDAWTMRPGDGGSMVVYLGEGVERAAADALVAELRRLPGVEQAELVPPVESAKRLQQALGGDASLMEGIDPDSLPASVEITLAPGVREVVAMSPTVRALRGAPGVEDVVVDEASEDRATAALGTVRTIVWTGAALLAGLALLVALGTIRLRLDRDPEEQRVAHMLGAGPTFLLAPTIVAGMLLGALAALLAGGAIIAALCVWGDAIVATLAGPLGAIQLALPTAGELALFVGLGAALGLLGGGLAGASRVAR